MYRIHYDKDNAVLKYTSRCKIIVCECHIVDRIVNMTFADLCYIYVFMAALSLSQCILYEWLDSFFVSFSFMLELESVNDWKLKYLCTLCFVSYNSWWVNELLWNSFLFWLILRFIHRYTFYEFIWPMDF